MYIRNYFLKQPRRGKTREALITPHKRSAVWGLMLETGSDCGDSDTGARSAIRVCLSLIIVVLLALASPLFAQHRDTLYVVEEEPVYDTLFVHDTLRVHDTLVPTQTDKNQPEKRKSKVSYYHALGVDYVLQPFATEYDNQKYYEMGVRLHVLNGIQFNPWLILSLDFQFAYTHGYDEDLTFVMPMKGISNGSKNGLRSFENVGFKLGLDFRYRWFNRFKWSPVIGIAGGPSIELTSYPLQDGEFKSYWGWGGYISNYLGCSYRYRNNKQLWFGASWTVDFGYVFIAIPLLGFRFEIQL